MYGLFFGSCLGHPMRYKNHITRGVVGFLVDGWMLAGGLADGWMLLGVVGTSGGWADVTRGHGYFCWMGGCYYVVVGISGGWVDVTMWRWVFLADGRMLRVSWVFLVDITKQVARISTAYVDDTKRVGVFLIYT